jgi:hypothetical protein
MTPTKSRKCCPSCKVHRVYEGLVCPKCETLGLSGTPTTSSSISELMPNKSETKWTIVQARVPKELAQEVREILIHEKQSWNALISACLRRYRIEMKGRK